MNYLLAVAVSFVAQSPATSNQPPVVEVVVSKSVLTEAFRGRVFVLARKTASRTPAIPWFGTEPSFAMDVASLKPETPLRFEPAYSYPTRWSDLGKEQWHLQAVLDRDLGGANCISSPGNLYSNTVEFDPAKPQPIRLVLNQVFADRKYEDSERIKFVSIDSKLLTKFHGKPMKLNARVVLPKGYAQGQAKYPVVYEIPGFGGSHAYRHMFESAENVGGVDMLLVMLDPRCRTGHHVFADSANNGPYGQALTEELIPHIEKTFRAIGQPDGRFLTGHSSGGWSSLWLQVTYPDFFNGTWSTAPDPVDFRDFQKVDIYAEKNIFFDAEKKLRPLSRSSGRGSLQFKSFSDMEVVMGHGGQLQSFEAVFSPRGSNGQPKPLWDRKTGVIDPKVAEEWKRYDIRLILETNWKTLGPKLKGKLRVITGAEDTFLLDGSTRLLQESHKKLGSDAVVELVPARHHGNLIDNALRQRIAKEMAGRVRQPDAR